MSKKKEVKKRGFWFYAFIILLVIIVLNGLNNAAEKSYDRERDSFRLNLASQTLKENRVMAELESKGYDVRSVDYNTLLSKPSLSVTIKRANRKNVASEVFDIMEITYKEYPMSITVQVLTDTEYCYFFSKFDFFDFYKRSLNGEKIYLEYSESGLYELEGWIFTNIIKQINEKYDPDIIITDYNAPVPTETLKQLSLYLLDESSFSDVTCEPIDQFTKDMYGLK